eukprot:gene9039-16682_t
MFIWSIGLTLLETADPGLSPRTRGRYFDSAFLKRTYRSRRNVLNLGSCPVNGSGVTNGVVTIPDKRKQLWIGLLLPFTLASHGGEYSGGGAKFYAEAFNLAVEKINKDSSLLPGYKLDYVFNNTRCSELDGIRAMYYQYQTRDRKGLPIHGFIGLGCQCSTAAKFASAMKVPIVSHMCSGEELSNKKVYPTFARTYPLGKYVIPSIEALLKLFKWQRVAVIYSNDSAKYQETSGELLHKLKRNISYYKGIKTVRYDEKGGLLEKILKEVQKKARIVILYMDYKVAREGLLYASKLGMDNGFYGFIVVELNSLNLEVKLERPFKWLASGYPVTNEKVHDQAVKKMFPYTLILGVKLGDRHLREEYKRYTIELTRRIKGPPFCSPHYAGIYAKLPVPLENIYLYDAVKVLALALNKTINHNKDVTDGIEVVKNMRELRYRSIDGSDKKMNKDLNSEALYSLLAQDYMNDTKDLIVTEAGYFNDLGGTLIYKQKRTIKWGKNGPPKDTPKCGFNNELCQKKEDSGISMSVVVAISVSTTVIGVILLLLPIFMYRQYRLERLLTSKLWRVSVNDLTFVNRHSSSSSTLSLSQTSLNSMNSDSCLMPVSRPEQDFIQLQESRTVFAVFKGSNVAVKETRIKSVELNRDVLLELKQIREMRHENICQFIGASVESDRVLIVTQYAARGSLEDVLFDSSIKLETLFLLSLIYDVVKGMTYLHATEVKSHGNLKSSNCVIDSRWVLKITDFGLHSFRGKNDRSLKEANDCALTKYLWRAPELLRMANPPPCGTEKGDVYSFAIILQECHTRQGPWSGSGISNKEILNRVVVAELPPYRPTVSELVESAESLRDVMKKCWQEHPDCRPTFQDLCKDIEALMKANGFKSNIVDHMTYMMERYTDHLEDLVEQKTGELRSEKARIEGLLERMLPASVARQLKLGREVEAETFKDVSIYFSDIVGFTELCAESNPMQVVKLLNDLYTLFDNIIQFYNVYKVETIGDAYMVVSGLPIRNEREHASEIALMALHINSSIKDFVVHHRPGTSIQLRIGINSGPVVAGVVGTTMPRYCLFGDTVNTASRMESTGAPSRVHISESTKKALDIVGGFTIDARGTTYCKGKGQILTFWLNDVVTTHKQRISENEKFRRCQKAIIGNKYLELFTQSPSLKHKVPSGTIKGSPDVTPITLRRAMLLKNIKNKDKMTSFDVPQEPERLPLLNQTIHGNNGVVT